jgi:hypothetical protein
MFWRGMQVLLSSDRTPCSPDLVLFSFSLFVTV